METKEITLNEDLKNKIIKSLSQTRSVKNGWDFANNDYFIVETVKYTDDLRDSFKEFNKFCEKNFTDGLSDSGTCVIGQAIEIKVAVPRKRIAESLKIVSQIWQGNTPNDLYFERIKKFVEKEIPQLLPLLKINHGRMD